MRKCKNCFATKAFSEFYKRLNDYQWWCKACHNEIHRAWRAKNRAKKMADGWKKLKRLEER